MTLRQWARKTGIRPSGRYSPRKSLCLSHIHPFRSELWRLDDYVVYHVTGLVIFLLRKGVEPSDEWKELKEYYAARPATNA